MGVGVEIKKIMDSKGLTVMDAVTYLENQGVTAKRTGENIKASTLYAFFNERRNMDASLVPYFSEWLDTPEQDFFDMGKRHREGLQKGVSVANGIDYEEILLALDAVGKTMPNLYKYVGYSRQSSEGYKNNGYIPIKHAKKIAEFFNVNISSVIDNNISDHVSMMQISNSDKTIQLKENIISIPLASTGAGAEAIIDIETVEKIHIEKKLLSQQIMLKFDKNTMAFRVIGDSMSPKYNEDDILFVDMINGRDAVFGDGVWLVRMGDIVQIKQIQFTGHGEANIISVNPLYPMVNTRDDGLDWEILGKPFMRWGVEYFSGLQINE